MDAKLELLADKPKGTISPRLYVHFAEHLGRCCYDGLWCVNEADEYSHREDVITALKALPVPLLRWPGGCYADHYHWQDGIGPREQRKRRLGMSCGLQVEDDNSFGTHEFIAFCRRIGAEPYLAGNVGSGSPQELCDWLEYCNATANTSLVQQRQQNGSAQPFNVRLWGVGNENWGCGGNFDAVSYAREYRRFATMLRHVDPTAELVICGSGEAMISSNGLENWNIELIQTLRPHLPLTDHLSIHCYWINGGPETDFTDQQYYGLLTEAQCTEGFVIRTAQMLAEEAPGRKIGVALDEWGVWHPEAREWGPGDVKRRNPVTYEQANTLRDALAVGAVFEAFHRQCQVMSMANLAQIVNVLQSPIMTSGSQMWLTPTYHALHLHTPHIGALALPVETQQAHSLPDGSLAVTATASRSDQGLAVTIINRHYEHEATVWFNAAGEQAHARLLSADSANACNDPQYPDRVRQVDLAVTRDGKQWCVEMPPHSMATVIVQ